MIEVHVASYHIAEGGRQRVKRYWRVFQNGEHVTSFETEAEAKAFAEQLRDCERLGA